MKAELSSSEEVPAASAVQRDPWRKWMWLALGLLVAAQIYYFQEMFAALLIFTVLFAFVAAIVGLVYLLGSAGEAGIVAAEPAARHGLAVAGAISRKTFHRQHSTPAP
jgi:hypothetical protein